MTAGRGDLLSVCDINTSVKLLKQTGNKKSISRLTIEIYTNPDIQCVLKNSNRSILCCHIYGPLLHCAFILNYSKKHCKPGEKSIPKKLLLLKFADLFGNPELKRDLCTMTRRSITYSLLLSTGKENITPPNRCVLSPAIKQLSDHSCLWILKSSQIISTGCQERERETSVKLRVSHSKQFKPEEICSNFMSIPVTSRLPDIKCETNNNILPQNRTCHTGIHLKADQDDKSRRKYH